LGIGVVIAFIVYKGIILVNYVLGGIIGFLVGSLLYTVVLTWFPTIDINVLFYVSIGVCIILAVFLFHYFGEFIYKISTSLVGGYLTVRVINKIINNKGCLDFCRWVS
jgi:hypothetical protein